MESGGTPRSEHGGLGGGFGAASDELVLVSPDPDIRQPRLNFSANLGRCPVNLQLAEVLAEDGDEA